MSTRRMRWVNGVRVHMLSAAFERLIQERDQGREDASSAFNHAQQWKKKAIAAGATPTLASPNPNPTLLG